MIANLIGHQLRHPRGMAGMCIGWVMRIVNARPYALAVTALDIGRADDVLELGCGPGFGIKTAAAAAPGGVVHAIDHAFAMIESARSLNADAVRQGRVRLYQARCERLPIVAASIDKVLAVNVAYFWDDAPAVLAEIHRVLRPGGRIAIYVTERAAMADWSFAGHGTHRLYDLDALNRLFVDARLWDGAAIVERVRLTRRIFGLVATAQKK